MSALWRPASQAERIAYCAPWLPNPERRTPRWWKGPLIKAAEAKYGRPFWDVVASLARRGKSKTDVARILGYERANFIRLLRRHQPAGIEWPDTESTEGMKKARANRVGRSTPAMHAAMAKARSTAKEWCTYDLGGFVGTIAEHCARQGLNESTVRGRKARGWMWSEALEYTERASGDKSSPTNSPKKRQIEERYGKPFDQVLADLHAAGVSQAGAAKEIGYNARALGRYCAKNPGANPWAGKSKAVITEFRRTHGIELAEWLAANAGKFTLSAAARFAGYAHASGLQDYIAVNKLALDFLPPGRHEHHRGRLTNLSGHAKAAGIKLVTLNSRMSRGMTLEQALSTPVKPRAARS